MTSILTLLLVLVVLQTAQVFGSDKAAVIKGATVRFDCKSSAEPVWEQRLKSNNINLALGAKKFPYFKNER